MTAIELQDFLHVYSMISSATDRKEPGLLLNKYDAVLQQVRFTYSPGGNAGVTKPPLTGMTGKCATESSNRSN